MPFINYIKDRLNLLTLYMLVIIAFILSFSTLYYFSLNQSDLDIQPNNLSVVFNKSNLIQQQVRTISIKNSGESISGIYLRIEGPPEGLADLNEFTNTDRDSEKHRSTMISYTQNIQDCSKNLAAKLKNSSYYNSKNKFVYDINKDIFVLKKEVDKLAFFLKTMNYTTYNKIYLNDYIKNVYIDLQPSKIGKLNNSEVKFISCKIILPMDIATGEYLGNIEIYDEQSPGTLIAVIPVRVQVT